MASYKRQRKHGVRAQTIQKRDLFIYGGEGAGEDDPEINRMSTTFGDPPTNLNDGKFGTPAPSSTAPTWYAKGACLNNVLLGSGRWNRTGSIIELKRLRANLDYDYPLTIGGSPIQAHPARCIVVYDSQTNGITPLAADIFQKLNYAGTMQRTTGGPIKSELKDRFTVLYERFWSFPKLRWRDPTGVSQDTETVNGDGVTQWTYEHIDIDLTGLHTTYNNQTAASYDPLAVGFDAAQQIMTGGIFVFFLSPTQDPVSLGRVWGAGGDFNLDFTA